LESDRERPNNPEVAGVGAEEVVVVGHTLLVLPRHTTVTHTVVRAMVKAGGRGSGPGQWPEADLDMGSEGGAPATIRVMGARAEGTMTLEKEALRLLRDSQLRRGAPGLVERVEGDL
jgi:hypothetical protein